MTTEAQTVTQPQAWERGRAQELEGAKGRFSSRASKAPRGKVAWLTP